MTDLRATIAELADRHGFILYGFASLRPLEHRETFFKNWLKSGYHGEMAYLAREPERRIDPRLADSRLRSAIVLAYPYVRARIPEIDWRAEMRGRIASYALGDDYHRLILAKLKQIAKSLLTLRPDATFKTYVDTGPVLEREWATLAGLGWIGKNTTLLNRQYGSYFFLAEIFTDLDLGDDGLSYRNYCGRCRRCLELCPTGALKGAYVMDARLCISYLTIELRGPIPRDLRPKIGNWIFGCDICQEVCPWNKSLVEDHVRWELFPYLPHLLLIDEQEFSRRFARTAIKRAKRSGFLRNVAVALGNLGNPRALPTLILSLSTEKDPVVRAHVAWALGQIRTSESISALKKALTREEDANVREEIISALEEAG